MGVALVPHKTPTNIRALRRLQTVIKKRGTKRSDE